MCVIFFGFFSQFCLFLLSYFGLLVFILSNFILLFLVACLYSNDTEREAVDFGEEYNGDDLGGVG